MRTVTFKSLQADQAWLVVSEQLTQRNMLLSRSISKLEQYRQTLPVASRLMTLRYHLRQSLRRLAAERSLSLPATTDQAVALNRQWCHVHELYFLLRQVDTELTHARDSSEAFDQWLDSLELRVYKSALTHLN